LLLLSDHVGKPKTRLVLPKTTEILDTPSVAEAYFLELMAAVWLSDTQ
jgi:hypothetical protein